MSLNLHGEASPPENETSYACDYENHETQLDIAPSAAPVKPFRFMDLPAETREKIYHFASPAPIKATTIRVGAYQTTKPMRYALAQASRTTREEALAVYFSKAQFAFRISSRNCSASHGWIDAQDETAVSCMRKIELYHHSTIDHGNKQHRAKIYVNMVQGTVDQNERVFASCKRCIKGEVLPNIIKGIQEILDAIEAVDGRKRLTKSLLHSIIQLAHGMCRP